MTTLFHPTYIRTDPKTGEQTTHELRKWYGRYRDASGVVQRVPLCTDKAAAQTMLADLIRKAERQQAGLIDPASEQLARTIKEHIDDFRKHLRTKDCSKKHVSETIRIISTITSACSCSVLADLQRASDSLEGYLADRLESGSSHRTINADITAIRSFCRWLLSKKRMHEDPTLGLTKLNEDVDQRLNRRALTDEEAQKLVEMTNISTSVFHGLTGRDRALLYLVAQRTGLRRGELRSLTGRSFNLTGDPPTVMVTAGDSKRRKKDVLPLSKETAQCLATHFANRKLSEPLWPGSWWQRSAEMLRQDLLNAEIESKDDEGQVVDFHGQRTTFITSLARAGVAPATAQRLARHSDINLTMGVYTKLGMEDLSDAVNNLPELRMVSSSTSDDSNCPSDLTVELPNDSELKRVVASWPRLSEPIRRAILSLLDTSGPTPGKT
jgi:site-specific recombinase XerC